MAISPPAFSDALQAIHLTYLSSRRRLIKSWLLVPLGITSMLAFCFGIDAALRALAVPFPASVACMVLLLLGLLASESVLGTYRTRRVVAAIDGPADWLLRWINVFFTPSFVLLPLSPPIGGVQVAKIIGVFVVGFFVMMAIVAYLTRSIQIVLGTSKRRADDPIVESDIPLTPAPGTTPETSRQTSISNADSAAVLLDGVQTPPALRVQDHHTGQTDAPAGPVVEALTNPQPAQTPLPSRSDRWNALLTTHLDTLIFTTIFLFIGIPTYYLTPYAMPLHLTVSILCYFAALSLPANWRTYLHPVLVSSLLTVLSIWAFAATKGVSLDGTLKDYRTGDKYIQLWRNPSEGITSPGAGDVFATLLDASIISLALPMFQHRRELRSHALPIIAPSVLTSVASLFSYPPLCASALGISPKISLAFASRSLTLALATPATENLGGDVHAVAALAIISGILGVLVGQRVLNWMRIPEDDYVTRGVTLGVNSSAIATALLLKTDPRAAALSSLSMSLFGTVTVLFTSIPPIAQAVKSLGGLS